MTKLCVSGDSLLLTQDGYKTMIELEGQTVSIWNGIEFTNAIVKKAELPQVLYLLITSDGCELKCTIQHSFFIVHPSNQLAYTLKQLYQMNIGDEIISCDYPVLTGDAKKDIIDPYNMGLLVINGDIYDIPMNASFNNKLFWLAGFIDGNGELLFKDGQYEIKISYMNKDFLYNIKLMCNTIRLNPRIMVVSPSIVQLIEHLNGRITYNLYFNPKDTYLLLNTLVSPIKKFKLPGTYFPNSINIPNQVVSINKLNECSDVYYFEEPKRGAGITNGLING